MQYNMQTKHVIFGDFAFFFELLGNFGGAILGEFGGI